MAPDDTRPNAEPDERHSAEGSTSRRQYLLALGALGALGAGVTVAALSDDEPDTQSTDSGGTETPAATAEQTDLRTTDPNETSTDDGDWEAAADERIRRHRTADLSVAVSDADGRALDGVGVAVEMRAHDYGFGTAVNAPVLLRETEAGDEYREYIPELFNKAVLENHHKWRFWEQNRELADAATDWLLDQGLDLRGHVCIWQNPHVSAIPEDVLQAVDDGDAEHILKRTTDHIRAIIEHYGDRIDEWEVVNEQLHEHGFTDVVDPEASPGEAPTLAEWYRTAEEVRPEGVPLAINEYNVLVGPHESERVLYEREIQFLLDEGIDLGGIGLQCHFAADERLDPVEIVDGLDRYASLGVPLRITEFDTYQGDWEDDEQKAEYLRTFLKTVYSHPATEDFLMWGFWDGRHWGDDAPLFYEDWSKKPAYDAYTGLVLEEWWTDESGITEGGTYDARAFLGEHAVTLSLDGGDLRTDVSIGDPGERELRVVAVDIDVRETTDAEPVGGDSDGVPVAVSGGRRFDPDDLALDTVRFGAPAVVNDGGGRRVRDRRDGEGGASVLYFDAGERDPDGPAMLRGETDDGAVVVGFDG